MSATPSIPSTAALVDKSIPTKKVHTYKEHWVFRFGDQFRLFGVQLICAGGSGALAKTAVAPLERIKILLQVQPISAVPAEEKYKGLVDAWRRIPQREGGFKTLYRGNGANVLRLVPDIGLKFLVHDQFKIMFAPADGSCPPGLQEKLAAGAATGILKVGAFYPLDLCRTRITADTAQVGWPRLHSNVRQCLRATYRHEGVAGLYKGSGLALMGVVPYLSISFAAYDQLNDTLNDDKHAKAAWYYPLLKLGCGAGAAVAAQSVCYPLDTVRRRMQMNGAAGQAVHYKGILDCVRTMVKTEGLHGFYRGALVNALKTTPGAAIQFVTYDLLKVGVTFLDPTTGLASPL